MTIKETGDRNRNVLIGTGNLLVADLKDDLTPDGWRPVGPSRSFALSFTEQRVQVQDPDGPIGQNIIDRIVQKDISATATLLDMSAANLALLLSGDESTEDDPDAAQADFLISGVKLGRWYELGVGPARPMGYLDVKAAGFTVHHGADDAAAQQVAAPELSAGEYEVDKGMIYLRPDVKNGVLSDGDSLLIDMTPAGKKHERAVTPNALRDKRVAVLYKEDSVAGVRGRNVKIAVATVGASGETPIKDGQRTNPQTINLTFGVIAPPTGNAIIIDGEAA